MLKRSFAGPIYMTVSSFRDTVLCSFDNDRKAVFCLETVVSRATSRHDILPYFVLNLSYSGCFAEKYNGGLLLNFTETSLLESLFLVSSSETKIRNTHRVTCIHLHECVIHPHFKSFNMDEYGVIHHSRDHIFTAPEFSISDSYHSSQRLATSAAMFIVLHVKYQHECQRFLGSILHSASHITFFQHPGVR